jgi:hypothetical protein
LAEPEAGRSSASQPAGEDSKGISTSDRGFVALAAARLRASGRSGWLVFGLGLVSAIVLVVAELSKVISISVVTATCQDLAQGSLKDQCVTTGAERHHGALLLIAVLLVAMAWGAAVGRSRPAAAAMVVLGLVPLGLWFFGDRHQVGKTGAIGADFSEATAHAGAAIPLEIAGGLIAIVAGAAGLRRQEEEPEPEPEPD